MHFKIYQNKKLIIAKGESYNSFLQRLIGFMFYINKNRKTIFFKKVKIIHNFFVFISLAVLVLNKEKRVIKKFILRPFRISGYYPDAEYIIESNELNILKKIKLNQQLEFQPIREK